MADTQRDHRRGARCRHPKIAWLRRALTEHADAIEADLSRYHQVNLWQDLGTTRLTWRRLAVLVRHLPVESSTVRAVRPAPDDDGHHLWSYSEILLAHVWQAVAHSKAPHPMLAEEINRAKAAIQESPQRARKRREAAERSLERQKLIDAGIIT